MNRNVLITASVSAALLGGLLSEQSACSQQRQDSEASSFDVVSIKRLLPANEREGVVHKGCTYRADGITCQSSLLELIEEAYQAKAFEIAGPEWLHDDVVFSFRATMAPGTTREQAHLMLQKALAERFELRLHDEIKPLRIAALDLGKTGLSLLKAASDPEHREKEKVPFTTFDGSKLRASVQISSGRFYAVAMSLDSFAENYLSMCAGMPVINMTGLTGEYKIDLHWTATQDPSISYAVNDPEFLRTAEARLGLQLEKRVVPYKLYVISHANRTPSED